MNAASSVYGNANTPIEDLVPSDDEDIVTLHLSEQFKTMNLARRGTRFFGKSSGVMLIQKAIDLKKEVTGSEESRDHFLRPLEDGRYPVRSHRVRLQRLIHV